MRIMWFSDWGTARNHTVLSQESRKPVKQVVCCSWPGGVGALSLLNVFGHLAWKQKSDECTLHIYTLGIIVRNWHRLLVWKFLHVCRKVGLISYPKDFTHAVLALAGKTKDRYFFNSSCIYISKLDCTNQIQILFTYGENVFTFVQCLYLGLEIIWLKV